MCKQPQECFHLAKLELHPLYNNPPFPPLLSPQQPPFCFPSLWIWLLQGPHISGLLPHLSFWDWLIFLNIHAVACVRISFFSKVEEYCVAHVDHTLFIRSSIDGHLGASASWLLCMLFISSGSFPFSLIVHIRKRKYILNYLFTNEIIRRKEGSVASRN